LVALFFLYFKFPFCLSWLAQWKSTLRCQINK
jgi:hypothetical protein